jgi:hypothetical protein
VPEGTTKAQLVQKLQANGMDVPAEWMPAKQARATLPPMNVDPTEGMSGFEKFAAGAGKAVADIGRGVRQYLPESIGGLSSADIEEAKRLDAPLMATGAGMAGNVAGNVMAAIPSAFIPGAATIPGAAAIGGIYGALQPGENAGDRMMNTVTGAAGGAVVPAAQTAYKVGKSLLEPLYQGGREQIMGRALRGAAGGQADEALRNLKSASELVPGSKPTVGQASGVPSLAALERTAAASSPDATNAMAQRLAAQNEARIAALQGVTPDVAAAKAARSTQAGALYNQARSEGLDPAIAQQLQPQIQSLMQRVPDDLVAQAKQLAQVSGEPITDMGSVQGAHYLKKAIDAKIGQAARAGDNQTVQAYEGLQSAFLDVLDQMNPTYGAARQTYAQMSKPVTQGQILEQIGQRGQNFRGELTPAAFARSVNDRTAQSVTRMPSATLESTLSPDQLKTLRNIQSDLLRQDFAQTAGRGAGSDTVQKLAYSNILNQSGLPNMVRNFAPASIVGNLAQRAGQVVYKDANERMAAELAQALMDPQQAAKLMEAGMVTPQMQALIMNLRRGGAAAGASLPGLANANQE